MPRSERHRPATGGPQGRSAGESERAKPRGYREEARVAGTRSAVIKASSLNPRHLPGLLRPSEAEAPRCGSRGWSARRSQSWGGTPKRGDWERRLARPAIPRALRP